MDIPELDIEDDNERRAALLARFGEPEQIRDRAAALRVIGRRSEVHPDDVQACTYPTRECAEVFAEANRRYNGLASLGICAHEDAWLGVTDLRPQMSSGGTDPAAPDDGGAEWRKQNRRRAAS
jgi:hypothetical protein